MGNSDASTGGNGVYSNSSTLTTIIPIDGPADNGTPVVVGLFSATITTTVTTTSDSDVLIVFSVTTLGPAAYGASATTSATVSVNGLQVDSSLLTPQPAISSTAVISLGGTTLTVPGTLSGNITVTTTTTWTIPNEAGTYTLTQTVTVKVGCND